MGVRAYDNINNKKDNKYHNLATVQIFYNTPLNDFQNTIHFKSNAERDDYFLNGKHFPSFSFESKFNFIRDRLELRVPLSWQEVQGANYCTFLSDFEPDRRYYAFIMDMEYINDEVVKLSLVIDTIMTFTQGDELEKHIGRVNIDRQHLTDESYQNQLQALRNNDDVLKMSEKLYIANYYQSFGDNYVLWQSSADLRKKFGDEDHPRISSSKGTIYDKITSPVDLYLCKYEDFNSIMDKLSEFPWITQNFQKIQLIPSLFIDNEDLEKIKTKEDIGTIYTLKSGKISNRMNMENIELTFNELCETIGFDPKEHPHLCRNEYMTIELYDWANGSLFLDAGFIRREVGLKLRTRSIIGYHNEIKVYPERYKSADVEQPVKLKNGKLIVDRGVFLNESLTIDTFAQVPILIDNAKLSMAQTANKRQLAQDRLVSSRLGRLGSANTSAKEKFYDATSLLSNLNPTQLFSKFNEEYEYYRDLQAEQKDLALTPPTETPSEMGNAFAIANEVSGITLKIGGIAPTDVQTVVKYYNMFGYEQNVTNSYIDPIDSMTICNYLSINGNYTLPNVDTALMGQLKSLLEYGVRFWHNDGTPNPMEQEVFFNKRRK